MKDFLDSIDILIDYIADFFINLGDFLTLGVRSSDFLFGIFEFIPSYFYIGIAPFVALFVLLMVLDRG